VCIAIQDVRHKQLHKEGINMKVVFRGILLVLLLVLLGAGSALASVGQVEDTTDAVYGGTFVYPLLGNIRSLDPAYSSDDISMNPVLQMFSSLVVYDPDAIDPMRIVGDLADSWEASPDGKVWTFHLRDNAKFHNGRTVTAEDCKYSWERVLSPSTSSPMAWALEVIEGSQDFEEGKTDHVSGISVVDEHTLRLAFGQPVPFILTLLTMPTPWSVVPREEVEKGNFSEHPVGSGPFEFVSWVKNSELVLKKNPSYFIAGRPFLDKLVFKIIPNPTTLTAAFLTNNVSFMEVSAGDYPKFIGDPSLKELTRGYVRPAEWYVGLNNQHKPLDNPLVRQAVNYAVNKEDIIEILLQGRAYRAYGPIPKGFLGYDPSGLVHYDYDPQKAKELLTKAGYPNGFSFDLYLYSAGDNLKVCTAIKAYLEDIDVHVNLVVSDRASMYEAVGLGTPDSFFIRWGADYADPDDFIWVLFNSANIGAPGNRQRYSNSQVDKLSSEARSTFDESTRSGLYKEAEMIIVKDASWIFLYQPVRYLAIQRHVHNFHEHPIDLKRLTNVWLTPIK